MSCSEVQKFLDAYIDDELDLVHKLEMERHLQDCIKCQITYQNYQTIGKGLKAEALYYKPPADFEKRVRSSLRRAATKPSASDWQIFSGRGLALSRAFGALIVFVVVGGLAVWLNFASNRTNELSQEVLASHIRSLMVNHLADVVSTDQHTVKPWFNGKLDFSPVVEDFADKGYPLTGGRLDYLDNQAVAALVYERGKHVINVFIWRNNNPQLKENVQGTTLQGYHLFHWNEGGFNYWAISDLNETELKTLVDLVRVATGGY
jgi:anti-sigma factor RsiW